MQYSRFVSLVAASAAVALGGALIATVPQSAEAAGAPTAAATATGAPVSAAPTEPAASATATPAAPTGGAPTGAAPRTVPTATAIPTPTPAPGPITVTVAGDSLTQMKDSWALQLRDPAISMTGGVTIGGGTTTAILKAATPRDADVLVVMAGTNDLRYTYTSKQIQSRIVQIVQKVGARHVVIAAIAPSNITKYGKKKQLNRRASGAVLNRDLQGLAADHGWLFADPWASVRRLDGGWNQSKTLDGVHPTVAVSKRAAQRMQAAIHIAANGASS